MKSAISHLNSHSSKKHSPRETGLQLKFARLRRGVQQQHLAHRIGISPALLSYHERGLRYISPERVTRIYKTLAEWDTP